MSEAPERIWLDWPDANRGDVVYDEPPERETQPGQTEYVRADVSFARIAAEAKAHEKEIAVWAENCAALERQLAEARKVKPLEWVDFDGLGAKASAFYQANYLIQKWSGEGRFEVSMSYPGYQTGYDGPRWHPTLEAAKAAAQVDYTARVLAALSAVKREAGE